MEIVGGKIINPLADYPHARFHCATVPFLPGAGHCPMCYCWVCDVPVAECEHWAESHATATPGSARWKQARRLALLTRKRVSNDCVAGAAGAAGAGGGAAAPLRWSTMLNDVGRPARAFVDPLALPINLARRREPVRVVSSCASSSRTRKHRGTFCSCYTNRVSAGNGQGLDNIVCAVSPSDFKAVAEHSGVSGRGVPYLSSILSDFPCMWSCKQCGRCPQVDIAGRLDRKRKRKRREIMAMRNG